MRETITYPVPIGTRRWLRRVRALGVAYTAAEAFAHVTRCAECQAEAAERVAS